MRKVAFTLIELLIVIVIIGAIYALAVVSIRAKKPEESPERWRLERLDLALKESGSGWLQLYCEGENCENCRVIDAKGVAIVENLLLFESRPIARYYDETGVLTERQFFGERCFEMERYDSGAISELLLEYGGKFYRYFPAVRRAEIHETLDTAMKSIDARLFVPESSADFYSDTD
ncbi:MAG: prepilin-type N-terminal cleavage/methylation domain-containing protein [Helicobacteraceae bacterium]|nr:prepilin-type N-terminal cleavage/methylation domain-containing protein [Helicobacteraceae bacterium]